MVIEKLCIAEITVVSNSINRRQFVVGLSAAIGASTTLLGAKVLAAASSNKWLDSKGVLSVKQLKVIEIAADIIIPTTDTPGAAAAGVHHHINRVVSYFLSEQDKARFLKDLEDFTTSQGDFLTLNTAQQTTMLKEKDKNRESDEFFRSFKEAVVFSYYTSKIGASQELNYIPVPGPYREIPFSSVGKIWSNGEY